MIKLKYMPASIPRAIIGAIGLVLIGVGAALLWGAGGALLTVGLVIFIDTSLDEIEERFTGIKRGPIPKDTPNG